MIGPYQIIPTWFNFIFNKKNIKKWLHLMVQIISHGEMTIYNALITMSAEPGPRTLGLTVNNVDLWVQANDEMTRT